MSDTKRGTPALAIDLSQLSRWVVVASAVIVLLGIVRELVILQIGYDTPLKELRHIALDSELSLPAFYSALLILANGLILLTISRLAARAGDRDAPRWMLLGIIFCLMAIDEAASFHESLMMPLRNGLGLTGIFYYSWVIPGAIGVALIGAYYLPFLLRLPRRTAIFFSAAGAAYVGGALGMELIGGALEEAVGKQNAAYSATILVEEGLEILGLTLFFHGLVDHVARVWRRVDIRLEAEQSQAVPAPRPVRTAAL